MPLRFGVSLASSEMCLPVNGAYAAILILLASIALCEFQNTLPDIRKSIFFLQFLLRFAS